VLASTFRNSFRSGVHLGPSQSGQASVKGYRSPSSMAPMIFIPEDLMKTSAPEQNSSISAGFVVQKSRPMGGDAVHTLHEFLNCLPESAALQRSTVACENGLMRERVCRHCRRV
jgi:hypothetical protein